MRGTGLSKVQSQVQGCFVGAMLLQFAPEQNPTLRRVQLMKKSILVLAAALLTIGSAACSSKPKREEAPQQPAAVSSTYEDPTMADESGSVSGAPTSLGAPSSGRGH